MNKHLFEQFNDVCLQNDINPDLFKQILDEMKSSKRFGLIYEDHPELIEEQLKYNNPLLTELKERRIDTGYGLTNNMLIEGDNLESLLALQHIGKKVDVIYIDPPYNTGNEFKYNDKIVDKEDSFRHSKWLSFMEKRLVVARDLLEDDGVIFVSIDDNEQANLKLLMDDVFGEENFLNTIIWHYGKMSNESRKFANNHEYIMVYGKSLDSKLIPVMKKEDSEYKTRWLKYVVDNKIHYKDVKNKNDKMINARIKTAKEQLNVNELPDDYILYDFDKIYKVDSDTMYVPTIKGNAEERVQNFGTGQKPLNLIFRLLSAYPNKNAKILDFFAGSGTTGHAVLDLNKQDGGKREFILCTNNENNICEDVTYERLRKVIQGYTTPKGKNVEGLPANLMYMKIEQSDKSNNDVIFDTTPGELLKQHILNSLKVKFHLHTEITVVDGLLYSLKNGSTIYHVYFDDLIDESVLDELELDPNMKHVMVTEESLLKEYAFKKRNMTTLSFGSLL